MRRFEREVKDKMKIRSAINESEVLRIGYFDNGEVYIVPVNFGYEEKDGKYTFYFHGAKGGRKYELSKNGCSVGFELESSSDVVIDYDVSCRSTCFYRSIVGNGEVSLIDDIIEKERSFNLILNHFTGKALHHFDKKYLQSSAIFKLEAKKLSCKERT